jgi:diadenosine tetraphosphate (Ap4A) HIT family hydrolase
MSPRKHVSETEPEEHWNKLYQVAGVSALLTAILIVIQMVVFILFPPPGTAIEIFTLFQDNTLLGFLALDLLYVIDNILLIPILLALYVTLRRTNLTAMLIAAALGFIGIAALIASNPAAGMHTLSGQYAAAGTDTQRAIFLAAGEAMLTGYTGTAYHVSLILGSVALVIISIVMLRDGHFNKATAIMGILANVLALGLYVPNYGTYILLFSVLFLLAWYVLIAWNLIRLGQSIPDEKSIKKNRRFQFLTWRKIRRRMIRWVFRHMSFAIPVKRLRETSTLMAFRHPQPVYPFHILLTAKRSYASLMDIPADDSTFMRELIGMVQSLIKEFNLEQSGYRLITNGGVYQDIPQLHFHLISDEVKQGGSGLKQES